MDECTDLVRLALLVVIDDEAELTSRVLLTVLELAVDFDLVALYRHISIQDVYEYKDETRTTWLELADLGDVLGVG